MADKIPIEMLLLELYGALRPIRKVSLLSNLSNHALVARKQPGAAEWGIERIIDGRFDGTMFWAIHEEAALLCPHVLVVSHWRPDKLNDSRGAWPLYSPHDDQFVVRFFGHSFGAKIGRNIWVRCEI